MKTLTGMTFIGHGDFNIALRGNILVVDAYGGWNKQKAIEFAQQSTALLEPIIGKSTWAILTDISSWELGVPEIAEVHKFNLEQAILKGCRCEAVVNTTGIIKLEQFNQSSPKQSDFEREFFDSKSAAVMWLSKRGFHL